ncbi:MAG TPA: glycosyltransferase family 61 protein, partial [Aeromicrobium sp.]|nr:glycosyltransferase family 61 protein [Aeromicrobium sp.]
MSRLPRPLEPIWPLAKRAHLAATVIVGALARVISPLFGQRGLPRHASLSSAATAAAEPATTAVHIGPPGEVIDRPSAVGEPPLHHVFEKARSGHLPDQHVLDLQDGTVVGDYGAIITTNGTLDFETSRYFSVYKWFEHPLFLRARLPRPRLVDGTVVSLATRGGDRNYYHFLLEVVPRWAMVQRILPDVDIDAVYAPSALGYQREFLALAGIDVDRIIPTGTVPSVRASRLLVPGYPNMRELQPRWMVDWVRQTFKPVDTDAKPRRLFVTRGSGPNTRRLIQASAVEAMLHERGFVTIDPGSMSVQEQIDHFAAADEVVGIHGAALTNLVFSPPGVRVLELFAPEYVNPCYWAVLQ